ncbi:hypothetical protein ccbrp13_56570 [Ktedonobacteria bacterium brp13]|nr:hypothetical protein ccbrp13_56570 [Ktedonobacteria bacterium brp13]
MMTPIQQPHNEIEQAMKMHIATLHDACFDLLAAIIAVILGITSVLHSLTRIAYAGIGLIVWTLGVWMISLQWLRKQCITRSSTSPFREVSNE